jgi:inner membrane protein
MLDSVERLASSIRSSQMLRLFSVGLLALLLQIPIAMIGGLVAERQERRQAAVTEVSSKWGNVQSIIGPVLIVPYTYRSTETSASGLQITRTETRNAIFLPEQLRVRGSIDAELRHRGIFSIPVYKVGLTLEGEFTRPSFAELGLEPAGVAWERAQLAIGISDARAIQQETAVTWNGKPVSFLPGTGAFTDGDTGIHAVVGLANGGQRAQFSFPLSLNGSLGVYLTPFAQNTIVELQSNYGHPSFQGNWLPVERSVSDAAFRAKWSIPFLGRNYPQAWKAEVGMRKEIDGSRFGVELVNPVDHYRMAERSVKYAGLFILLTFATLWLIEVLAGVRVHPIQYLLLGGALCLFYLLELSLSEHLGFPLAYTVASFSVVAPPMSG